MGSLHEGHLSLVDAAKEHDDIAVVSLFVNPTQFNQPEDLDKYPRNVPQDLEMLYQRDCDVVFVPAVETIYPSGLDTEVDIEMGGLDERMEGKFRPGHFAGVMQVVKRLLDIIDPDSLFMGQKDFQQQAVIRHMVRELDMQVEVVTCPIVREEHGLAMSSRNLLLPPDVRKRASVIYETLMTTKACIDGKPISRLEEEAMQALTRPGFKPEYFEIVDGYTLHPVTDTRQSDYLVACCAVWAGDVRLIDNMILKSPE